MQTKHLLSAKDCLGQASFQSLAQDAHAEEQLWRAGSGIIRKSPDPLSSPRNAWMLLRGGKKGNMPWISYSVIIPHSQHTQEEKEGAVLSSGATYLGSCSCCFFLIVTAS